MEDLAIRRRAHRLRVGIIATFALLLALFFYARFGSSAHVLARSRLGDAKGLDFNDGILVPLCIALFYLTEALRAVSNGGLFSRGVIRRFRLFALWLLVMALYGLAVPLLASLSPVTPAGVHRIAVVVDIRDALLVAITLLLFLLTRLLERAGAIEREMSEIV